jgi:hypothetical protein
MNALITAWQEHEMLPRVAACVMEPLLKLASPPRDRLHWLQGKAGGGNKQEANYKQRRNQQRVQVI